MRAVDGRHVNFYAKKSIENSKPGFFKLFLKYIFLPLFGAFCAIAFRGALAEPPDFTSGTLVCNGSSVTGQLTGNVDAQNVEIPVIFGTGSTITFTVTGANAVGNTTLLNAHHESGGTWSPTESGELTLTGQQTDTFSSTATAGSGTAIWHVERKTGNIDYEAECTGGGVTVGMTVEKTADPTTYDSVGDIIDYDILVTNTGNVTLTGITISDPLTGDEICPAATLAASASMTCTASYTITQADIDAGSVTNTATVGSNETGPEMDDATVTAVQSPSFTAVKSSVEGTFDEAGDVLTYEILVTNTGNVTLTGIAIADALTGDEACPAATLAPGADMTCTASYSVTQDDIDGGSVANTATVDTNETGPQDTNEEVVTAAQNAAMTVVKTAVEASYDAPGDVLNYEILVTNSGNITLTSITISDPLTGDETCPAATLSPGDDMTCTASYEVTQDDVDNGSVSNTVTVDSNETGGETDDETVTAAQSPSFTAMKSSVEGTFDEAGDVLSYEILVANTGNVTLTGITISDPLTGDESCPSSTLAAGDDMTCTASYTVTQDDIDGGSVANTATVDTNETGPQDTNEEVVTADQNAAFTVVKSSIETSFDTVGDTINYEILVTNTGNVTLTGITISDPLTGDESCPAVTLALGDDMTCTASYEVTQDDIDNGSVANTATVDTNEAGSEEDSHTVFGDADTSFTVVKSADPTTYDSVGDVLNFEILVTNTGTTTLTGITISDPLTGDESCPAATLAPGADMTCTASYTVTQDDIDGGLVANTATVDTNETGPQDTNEEVVTAAQNTAFTVEKTSLEGNFAAAGDVLNYEILVTNTGNVTLTGIAIDDALTGDEACPAATLAPGADMTCTASYTVTQDDVDAGEVSNTASVSANEGGPEEDTYTVSGDPGPSFTAVKSAMEASYDEVGDVITYEIVVTNTGTTMLTGITIDDPLTGDESCPASSLSSGADMTCTASYTITQADIDAGEVGNTATVDTDQTGSAASNEVTVTAEQETAFTAEKSALEASFAEVGDVINYEIVVTNTGNTTLNGITIDDPLTDDEACPAATLDPGESMTCTASYTVTQDDVDAGEVSNTASVDTDETGAEDSNEVTVPFEESNPAFAVEKTVDEENLTELATLTYTITVENTGNVPLTSVEVEDTVTQGADTLATPASALSSGDDNSNDILDVGETWVYTVTYAVTEADAEDGGDIVNTASVTTEEAPDPVEDSAATTLDIDLGIDEDAVREAFMNTTRAFLGRRIDRILSSEPEAYRIINRRSPGGGLLPRLSLNDGMGAKSASFAASLKGVRFASADGSGSPYGSGAGGMNGQADDRFDVWLEGEYSAYDDNLAATARDGRFGIVYVGADYRIHQRVLAGVMASFDWMDETSAVLKSEMSGNGWMAGPYLSAALGNDIYFEGRIAWGRSSNSAKIEVLGMPFAGDFDTTRWLMRANVEGAIGKGKLAITPHVAVAYMEEKQKAYTVFDGVHAVAVPGQVVALGRITVGPEFAYTIVGERGTTFVPFIRIDSLWDFESVGLISLNGVVAAPETVRAAIELGFHVVTAGGISMAFAGKYDGIGASGFEAWSVTGYINFPF